MGAIFIVRMFLLLYRLVKPGGVLVYSTCSIDHGENEERVTAFLLRHPVSEIYTINLILLYFICLALC